MASVLQEAYFHHEAAAFAKLESTIWPTGPVCPHCGNVQKFYALEGVRSKPSKKNPEGIVRHGLKKCAACRGQFTVRKNTVFEDSHVPLTHWFQAVYLMCSSKKGISANQLHRTLGCTLQTGWFIGHRIREAMRPGSLAPMGSGGGTVEVDETYIGRKKGVEVRRGAAHKHAVLTLVQRGGKARSFHLDGVKKVDVMPIVRENLSREARLMTDESNLYTGADKDFAAHKTVDHSREEYAYTDRKTGERVHTNTVEGYYSIFKRGMIGIYQHCSEKHLHRYLAEYDFRYSNRVKLGVDDVMRTMIAMEGIKGKRLTYETTHI